MNTITKSKDEPMPVYDKDGLCEIVVRDGLMSRILVDPECDRDEAVRALNQMAAARKPRFRVVPLAGSDNTEFMIVRASN